MWSPLWSILVCKIPQFLAKSYRFRQLITLFQKVDTLRLLRIYIALYSSQSQIPIFLGSSSWTIHFIPQTRHSLCTALFLTPTTISIKSGKMETESKSVSELSRTLFFVNIKSISIKVVNLPTKGRRHILKGQSKNEKLFKKLV